MSSSDSILPAVCVGVDGVRSERTGFMRSGRRTLLTFERSRVHRWSRRRSCAGNEVVEDI